MKSQASTRIAQAPVLKFIVRAVDNKTDPQEIVNVVQFEIKGKARRAELSKNHRDRYCSKKTKLLGRKL